MIQVESPGSAHREHAQSSALPKPGDQPLRIGIFRALMLGDMLCATPALRAVRAAWPNAHITLVGLPWAGGLVQRLSSVDAFEPLPGWLGLPELPPPTADQVRDFVSRVRARRFDVALQMHGSGQLVNALVASFGAPWNAGFTCDEAWFPPADGARFVEWPTHGHEILRLLTLTDHLGLPRCGTDLDLPLQPEDYARARSLVSVEHGYAVIHPGSQLASRRWPARKFAAVADRLAQAGLRIVLTGTAGERELVTLVSAMMAHPALNLCGNTDLWTLGALLASARVLVCNDTGLSHMAAALRTPSVVAACGSETSRWAPLDTRRHRVLWQDVACRPCDHRECPIGHVCAEELEVDRIATAALDVIYRGGA